MTQVLVRVSDAQEAARAAAAGIDAIEYVIDGPGAASPERARAIREAFPGVVRLRLTGDDLSPARVAGAGADDVDEIAVTLEAARSAVAADWRVPADTKLIAVLSPSDRLESIEASRHRFGGIMLDAGDGARLIDEAGIAELDVFASACRARGLDFGLAGGLEAPDIARLLLLEPDILAFDRAVRLNHAVTGSLEAKALDAIRALVPRHRAGAPSAAAKITRVVDRIFVRDFEVALAIGAYQAEHGKTQRVRFSVSTDVAREPRPPHDMRDVFSYDVIIETIRVLAERPHVTFVETLAEEVASALLMQPQILAVTVKVEKLDVIAGAVGIEILRRRDTT